MISDWSAACGCSLVWYFRRVNIWLWNTSQKLCFFCWLLGHVIEKNSVTMIIADEDPIVNILKYGPFLCCPEYLLAGMLML